MSLAVLSRREAFHRICLSRHIDATPETPDSPPDSIIAEYLRSALCALSMPTEDHGAFEPVYVTQFTRLVRRQLAPIWPDLDPRKTLRPSTREIEREGDTQPDPIRRVLDGLNDLREVCHLGHGYWLPCPVRLVELPKSGVLVIGGMTTAQIERTLRAEVIMKGIARILSIAKPSAHLKSERFRWQPFDAWLGRSRGNLEIWTATHMALAKSSLRPSASTFTSFEVYTPWLHKEKPQYFRWIRSSELSRAPADIVLCRATQGPWGPRNYWLAQLKVHGDAVFMDQEHEVEPADVRVLQYGLDLLAGAPTRAHIQLDGADVILTVRNWLPSEQRRLLLAIAQDVSPEVGRLPLKFRLSESLAENAVSQLRELGIAIETKS